MERLTSTDNDKDSAVICEDAELTRDVTRKDLSFLSSNGILATETLRYPRRPCCVFFSRQQMGFLEGVALGKLTDGMSHKQVEQNAPATNSLFQAPR